MDIFHFSSRTGEYLGQSEAALDPREGKPLVPANATTIAPPAADAGHVPVFEDGDWSQVVDHRGTEYWLDGENHIITEIGGVVPDVASVTEPQPPLEDVKATAIQTLQGTYAQKMHELTGGYPAAERDTWPMKREAARAHDAGNATATQTTTLTRFAASKGISVADYVALVLAKADGFEQISAACEGARNQGLADVDAAADAEGVQAAIDGVSWPEASA